NEDGYTNYIMAGAFNIQELIPMNYEQVEIWIDEDQSDSNESFVTLKDYVNNPENIKSGKVNDGKVVIDKDNPNLNIKVSNTLVNDKYWQDKDDVKNSLEYDKSIIGFIKKIKSWITEIFA
ncbi:MAG: hypothetical protein ACRDA5_09565, partial [Clostridium sp.]